MRRFGCEHLACTGFGVSCTLCDDHVKRKVRKIAEDANHRRASANAVNDAAAVADDADDDDADPADGRGGGRRRRCQRRCR